MHEAMESQRVSVAKAGITASLQCRCSMLGAANPKFGRFDDSEALASQINMPPALLSRFDLIFALTDKPNAARDLKIAEHILKGHVRGELRNVPNPETIKGIDYQRIMEETDVLKPIFDREFMRKYVAYAKRFTPVLSDEARQLIIDKYLSIRKLGEKQGSSVPITARQLEAFIRLSEASARIRLSQIVAKEDADRAIKIVEHYLKKMASDDGTIDVDKLMTGTTRNERNRIALVRQLIHDNSDPRSGISELTLIQKAGERNLSETDLKDALRKLKQAGDIYEAQAGHYKLATSE
jgi:replicative DNA helicase Mcm